MEMLQTVCSMGQVIARYMSANAEPYVTFEKPGDEVEVSAEYVKQWGQPTAWFLGTLGTAEDRRQVAAVR